MTRQRADPWDVDFLANLRVLAEAERSAVRSFLYVNVMHVWAGTSMILRSKAAFVAALERSSVLAQIVSPSGYFSDVSDFLAMARLGLVLLPPDPGIHIAPIHGADLADFCVERLPGPAGSWDVGGPDRLTYRQIAELAGAALDRRVRTCPIPTFMVDAAVAAASHAGRRPRDLAQFFAEGLTHEATGEPFGTRRLSDYFQEQVAPRSDRRGPP